MISDTSPPLLLSGCLILIPCSISAISEVFHPQIFVVAWFIRHGRPINWATTFLNGLCYPKQSILMLPPLVGGSKREGGFCLKIATPSARNDIKNCLRCPPSIWTRSIVFIKCQLSLPQQNTLKIPLLPLLTSPGFVNQPTLSPY